MENQKNKFKKAFFYGMCLAVYTIVSVTHTYAQKDLGDLQVDGNKHSVSYVDGKWQDAVIPPDVPYRYLFLSATGGDGGYKRLQSSLKKNKNVDGGRGALVEGYFKIGNGANEIPPGATIRFIVGQKGAERSSQYNGGGAGGGGTGIAYQDPHDKTKWKLLMVAGGGSGAYGDCCSFKKSKTGSPGRAYTLGQEIAGYREYASLYPKKNGKGDNRKRKQVGNSAYGGTEYKKTRKYDEYNKAGWLDGPDIGQPTGNWSFHESGAPRGGWGFGPGGQGNKELFPGAKRGGGGGGYRGGSMNEPKSKQNHGGVSFVEESMHVKGIYSEERGKTDKPNDGKVTYRFTNVINNIH